METAIKVSDHILDGIERLGDFPDSGSRTPDDWLKEQGYRMAISGKYERKRYKISSRGDKIKGQTTL